MESSSFIAATQKWVLNRIEDVKTYLGDAKTSIIDIVNQLSVRVDEEFQTLSTRLGEMTDRLVTGEIHVEGNATVGGTLDVADTVTARGVASSGPISCQDPAGLVLPTPPGPPPVQPPLPPIPGLNARTLTLMNERGKLARIFMRGDQLCCDYDYDKILTYFDPALGSALFYLDRGSNSLMDIVQDIRNQETTEEKLQTVQRWFRLPDNCVKRPVRCFNSTCYECFPALGTSYLLPQSMLFTVADMYKLDSIKLLDPTGQVQKILYDFHDDNMKRVLINFPSIDIDDADISGAAARHIAPVPFIDGFTGAGCSIPNIVNPGHRYYEATDSDIVDQIRIRKTGLIPTVTFSLDQFPKDQMSIVYFKVVRDGQ